jgi:hypothetical protein
VCRVVVVLRDGVCEGGFGLRLLLRSNVWIEGKVAREESG